ncbi:Major cardiolipin synthase ClsA [Paenibacillus konkukensis]|uniref:Cardiolipin synthase n=1 Tax=Paenibacillus konkukensis TaxID=2020716 RepID=A0ABY4RJN1_9BACL|nr:cardiolipin synthase [Paenibacillus konkukensis]UQZ82656.1 Major cardiolipin synthase ClsA [Paenibacillus konkukensis]
MFQFQDIYNLLTLLNYLFAVVIIFFERRNVVATWAWLMVLLFLPGVGFIIYLLAGRTLNSRRMRAMKDETREEFNAVSRQQTEQIELGVMHYADPAMEAYHDMMHMNLMSSRYSVLTQDNQVEIFTDGQSKFASLFEAIRQAKQYIHLQYYIVRADTLGQELIRLLAQKAREGVEVRLLYDDVGSYGLAKRFLQPLVEAGGEAAAFFPSRIRYLNLRLNYRNHRKVGVIDGKWGYIGGFNVGDEYLGRNPRLGYWRDTHLKLEGSAVKVLQAFFMMDWNRTAAPAIGYEAKYFCEDVYPQGVGMQIVSSGPHSNRQQIKNAYIKMIHSAKRSVCIQSPYFVPDESLLTALKMAALSGIDVKVMIPDRPDHFFVFWASRSYLGELLDNGVRCYLYEGGFLHAKTIVIDGKVASVGTANIDIRSFKLNFEINAFIYDTKTAGKLEELFAADLHHSRELTLESYKRRSYVSQLKESIARLLSPLL